MHAPVSDSSQAISCTIFGTINGVVGIVASIPEEYFQFFHKLEIAMESVIRGVGGFSHREWRGFCSDKKESEQSFNFIDGDLIESFLDLKKPRMEEVGWKFSSCWFRSWGLVGCNLIDHGCDKVCWIDHRLQARSPCLWTK